MNQQDINNLVNNLYHAVDNKDLDYLHDNLANQVRFRLGNNPAALEKSDIIEGNRQFFASITSMRHSVENILYQVNNNQNTVKVSCNGTVDYIRLDGSEHSVVFSTFLEVKGGLITDYLVFADLSDL